MTSPANMTTAELTALLASTDARIKDLDGLMGRTPRDTTAYAAMTESRPGLRKFRASLDDALASRGA